MIKTMALSSTIKMVSTVAGGNSFTGYIQFAPTNNFPIASVVLSNDVNNQAQVQGCLPGEKAIWPQLYAKTKLHKVVVKYIPAMTQGMPAYAITQTGAAIPPISFSAAATMYTIPIYDNVDEVINNLGVLITGTSSADLEKQLVKPYCRQHSIYKPWTRVLTPKLFNKYLTFENDDVFRKSGGYVDMGNDQITMNGLFIGMEPLTEGGLTVANTANDVNFPGNGQAFVLGELQFIIYQSFKTRT